MWLLIMCQLAMFGVVALSPALFLISFRVSLQELLPIVSATSSVYTDIVWAIAVASDQLRVTTSLGQFRSVPVLLDAVPQHLHYAAHLRDDRRSRYFAAFDSLCSLAFYLQTLKFMHFRSAAVWGTELLGGPARTEVHDILLVHSCARVHALPYLQLALHRWRIILLHVEDHPAILSVSAHLGIQLRGICVRAHIRSFVGQSAALRAEAGRICGQCHQACHREGPGEA